MNKKLSIAGAVIVLALGAGSAWAGDPVFLSISQGDQTINRGYVSLLDVFDIVKSDASIRSTFPTLDFSADAASNAVVRIGGVSINLASSSFAAGSQSLRLVIPELGIDQTFTGVGSTSEAARRDAYDRFTDYLKHNSDGVYSRLQRYTAAKTPLSSIAGNPASMQTRTAALDFDVGFTAPSSQILATPPAAATTSSGTGNGSALNGERPRIPNLFGMGMTYGRFRQNDIETTALTLPLSYTWRFSDDPRRQVVLSTPLSVGSVGGARTYAAQTALAVRMPVSPRWVLTPGVSYGITASADLAQAAQRFGGSLSSAYSIPVDETGRTVSIGNMVGYYRTLKLNVSGYDIDPQIANTLYRNGLMYSEPFSVDSHAMAAELLVANTQFTGSETYTRSQNEVSVTVGTSRNAVGIKSYLRAGLAYVQAKGSNGMRATVGLTF